MASIGKLENGKFRQLAGDYNILNVDVMTATSTSPGLLSVDDKHKIDISYTEKDVADEATIRNLFKKGE